MLARRGATAAARGGDDIAQTIWDAVAPATPVSFLKRVSATSYETYQQNGTSRYVKTVFNALSGLPGGYTPPLAINRITTQVPMLLVPNEDAAWSYTGTWTLYSSSHRSVIAGDYARFTSPSGTVSMGLYFATATNTGYAKVVINGDPTRATLLTTAQDEVTAGRLPSTVLVANGGTLNPTDRVADCYAPSAPRNVVDDLAPGVHTMDVIVTGYKRAASSDVRVSINGAYYNSSSVTPVTPSIVWIEDCRIMWASSNHEFAYSVTIGGVTEWTGSIPHGYEEMISTTITSDGVPQTLVDGQIIQSNTSLVIARTTHLHHPNQAHMADKTLTYTLDGEGLRVQHTTNWLTAATISAAYEAMLPVDGVGGADVENFTRGSGDAMSTDVALDVRTSLGLDPIDTTSGHSSQIWMWSPAAKTNRHIAAARMANASTTLMGWAHAGTKKSFLQDRSGLNKAYWTLKENGGGAALNVVNGTVWSSDTTYRWAVVTDADALCAR